MSTPRAPKRHDASSETATAAGTPSHSPPHGMGVCVASSARQPSSTAVRSHETPRAGPGDSAIEVTGERQQGQHARSLDRRRELLLMTRARARDATRDDLASIGDESAETLLVLVVDEPHLLEAQLA